LSGYKTESDIEIESIMKRNEERKKYLDTLNKEKEAIQEELNSGLAQIGYVKNLVTELESLVDANGKVKEGYDGRVSFILNELNNACGTEYQLINGTIDKYKDLKKSINEVIKTKEAEIRLEANQKKYAQAKEEQQKIYQEKKKALEDLKKAQEDLKKAEEEWILIGDVGNIKPQYLADLEDKVNELQGTYDGLVNKWQENAEIIIKTENLQVAIIEGDSKKIEEAITELSATYEIEGKKRNATLAEQIEMQQSFAEESKRIYKETGKEINEEEEARLNSGIETLARKLAEQTTTVENLTEDQIEAWKVLAQNSEQIYNEKISNVNEDTKFALETILGKIDATSPEYIEKWRIMANESNKTYNRVLSQLPENTRNKVQDIVGATNSKQNDINSSFNSLATSAINAFEQVSGYSSGENLVTGIERGVKDNKNKITKALTGLANGAVTAFNFALGICSPSKVMAKQAKFIPEGIAKGIDDNIKTVYNSMKDLSQGIMVNPNDFKIDTNQFIDYGQISGAIATQSNVKIDNDLDSRIENAIYRGLSNATIPVEIEATTDEGVIFKKVQVKAKEFTMQTGEPAFDF